MSKGTKSKKDEEMAAMLKKSTYHNGKAVAARKAARHKEFMRKLQGK